MMIFRNIIVFLLVFTCLFKPEAGRAQICEIIPATITAMDDPDIGAFNLWSRVHGIFEAREEFVSGVHAGEDFILLGTHQSSKEGATPAMLLVKLDQRGRVVWSLEHQVEGLIAVHRIVRHGEGYAVLATVQSKINAKQSRAMIGFFDLDGKLKGRAYISEDGESLMADDMIPLSGPAPNRLAVAAHVKRSDGTYFSIVSMVDKKGKVHEQRRYKSGANNRIRRLFKGKHDNIIGAGQSEDAFGRSTGWVVSLIEDLKLSWQRSYGRGDSAYFMGGAQFVDHSLVLVGSADPKDGDQSAGWVVRIDGGSGDIIWERYYRGQHAFEGSDVLASQDGILSVVLNGVNHPEEESGLPGVQDFARLLTMNKRGILLFNEDYLNARGMGVSQLLFGNRDERVLVGWTRSPEAIDEVDEGARLTVEFEIEDSSMQVDILEPVSRNAWALSVSATDPYTDPCGRGF